jgi:hypothetical protein
MGEVYRARDTKLGREVAIKILPEAFASDHERLVRFECEAKFLAALNHPNIAAIYGVEDTGSTDALVMELAEGSTLADRIALGPIPLKWIAYDSDETGRDEIFVGTFPKPGDKWQVTTSGGTRPVWGRDGKELYYIASDGNLMGAAVKSLPDGSFGVSDAKVLFDPHSGPIRTDTFNVTKDGRFLIPTLTQQSGAPITVVVNWHPQVSK